MQTAVLIVGQPKAKDRKFNALKASIAALSPHVK